MRQQSLLALRGCNDARADSMLEQKNELDSDNSAKISWAEVWWGVNVIMFDEPLTVIDPHLKGNCGRS